MEPQPESSDRKDKHAWADEVVREFEQARAACLVRTAGRDQGRKRTLLWMLLVLIVGLAAGALVMLHAMLPQMLSR